MSQRNNQRQFNGPQRRNNAALNYAVGRNDNPRLNNLEKRFDQLLAFTTRTVCLFNFHLEQHAKRFNENTDLCAPLHNDELRKRLTNDNVAKEYKTMHQNLVKNESKI